MPGMVRALLTILAVVQPALALDFVSTDRPALLYDAPSTAAEKTAIVSKGYPLEKIVTTAGWVKVRDQTGSLSWIEGSALTDKPTVIVNSPIVHVMENPSENAMPRFKAAKDVIFEILAFEPNGWVRVRHANGEEGFLRARDLWGL